MSISVNDAKVAAKKWVRENMWFEGRCFCMQKGISENPCGRFVEVRFRNTYLVMQLLVVYDGDVQVLKDRQDKITKIVERKFGGFQEEELDLQAIHDSNVEKVVGAVEDIWNEFPDWFGYLKVDEDNGMNGRHDLILQMKGKKGRVVNIWIKIVRTNAAKASFSKKISGNLLLRTIILTASNIASADTLKTKLVRGFEHKRASYKL